MKKLVAKLLFYIKGYMDFSCITYITNIDNNDKRLKAFILREVGNGNE